MPRDEEIRTRIRYCGESYRICKWCGNRFITRSTSKLFYCNEECHQNALNESRDAHLADPMVVAQRRAYMREYARARRAAEKNVRSEVRTVD